MTENGLRLSNTPQASQSFSKNGIPMEALKKENELLFNYFKANGYKEDSIIFSGDVDKLLKAADTNENGKLSIKEARALGLDGNRKEIRSAIRQLNEIKDSELPDTVDNNYAVQTQHDETTNYKKDGTPRGDIVENPDNSTEESFYINGDKSKLDKTIRTSADKQTIEETTYLNGDKNTPYRTTIKNGNDTTTIAYDWFNGSLNSKTTTHGNDVETTIYKQVMGKAVPQRSVEYFNSDSNSCKSTEFSYDDNRKLVGQTVEYVGAKIKDSVVKEEITIDPQTGEQTFNIKTLVDGSKQYFQNVNGKMQQIGKPNEEGQVVEKGASQNPQAATHTDPLPVQNQQVVIKEDKPSQEQPTTGQEQARNVTHSPAQRSHVVSKPKTQAGSTRKKSSTASTGKSQSPKSSRGNTGTRNNASVSHSSQNSVKNSSQKQVQKAASKTIQQKTAPINNQTKSVQSPVQAAASKKTQPKSVEATPSKPPKLKHVSYSYRVKGNPAEAPAKFLNARDLVRRSRLNKTAAAKGVNYMNIKNTMCYYNNKHNCTLPSALLRQYSRTDKCINGTSYTYSDQDILADLFYVKNEIKLAKSIGIKIPESLYAYVPPYKNATPERIKKEVAMYEKVFGKGSAHYQVS